MIWTDLATNDRKLVLENLRAKIGLDAVSIEEDWWVTTVLKALFNSKYASCVSFKGGSSLSKCFNLINRFSEDVDIAINREYLGLAGELTKIQISDKLRRASCSFVRESLSKEIGEQLLNLGIPEKEFVSM